jgi:hypothetical protein
MGSGPLSRDADRTVTETGTRGGLSKNGFSMREKSPQPSLRLVVAPGATSPPPALNLGEAGQRLWTAVQAEFAVDDVAGREILGQCCKAADRAEALAARISADGEIVRTKAGLKAHPALSAELAARGFVVKSLVRLGINYEPVRLGVGRPPGGGA